MTTPTRRASLQPLRAMHATKGRAPFWLASSASARNITHAQELHYRNVALQRIAFTKWPDR